MTRFVAPRRLSERRNDASSARAGKISCGAYLSGIIPERELNLMIILSETDSGNKAEPLRGMAERLRIPSFPRRRESRLRGWEAERLGGWEAGRLGGRQAHCSLFIVHCSLFIVHCSLFIAHCSLREVPATQADRWPRAATRRPDGLAVARNSQLAIRNSQLSRDRQPPTAELWRTPGIRNSEFAILSGPATGH